MASFLGNIGRAVKRAAPEMIRGALVAAANPTRGAVGTAGDIFGAIGAVEDDRMARMDRQRQREMQALEIRRKMADDAREAALNEARIAELNQRAEYHKRRGIQQAAGKVVPPSKLQMYNEAFDHYKGKGFSDEDAHVEARSIALGTPSPELYNKRTASSDAGQMNRELENWRKDPKLQEQFPKFEDYYKSIGIGASKADTTAQVTTAKKKAEIPFLIRRPIAGDDQYYDQKITLNPEGTGAQVSYPATGIKTRQPAPAKTPRDRYHYSTDENGIEWRINTETGEKTEVLKKKVPGGGQSGELKKKLIEGLVKGTKQTPKVSVGQAVRLKSGQTVTVKKVNPDGTFEY